MARISTVSSWKLSARMSWLQKYTFQLHSRHNKSNDHEKVTKNMKFWLWGTIVILVVVQVKNLSTTSWSPFIYKFNGMQHLVCCSFSFGPRDLQTNWYIGFLWYISTAQVQKWLRFRCYKKGKIFSSFKKYSRSLHFIFNGFPFKMFNYRFILNFFLLKLRLSLEASSVKISAKSEQ